MAQEEGMTKKRRRPLRPGILLLWLLVLTSLLLNVFTFNQLTLLRRSAQELVLDASAAVGDLQAETFVFTVPIDETIIIETDLPIEETVTVPIETELPINTVVTVTVSAGILGDIPLNIPISTVVPIDIMVDVPLDETFSIRAPVPLEMEVPIEFVVADEPLAADLEQMQQRLDEVAAELGP